MAHTFTLTIEAMDGAAFTNEDSGEFDPYPELSAILSKTAELVGEWQQRQGTIKDAYGNVVGKFEMVED